MKSEDQQIVLLTVAHYLNQREVLEFVQHANRQELPLGYELHFAVADNSQDWDTQLGEAGNLSVFRPSQNLGYLNGCAFAHRSWNNGNDVIPDWVAVVNTDIELSPGFMLRLLSHPFADKDAVIAPDILLPSGSRQNPFLWRRLTRARIRFYRCIFGSKVLGRIYLYAHGLRSEEQSLPMNDGLDEKPTPIYAPHGSAIFFRRPYFEAGGRLEFGSFLYCEELHVAEQALRNGLNVVWTPGLTLRHNQHSTTSSLDLSKRLDWMHQSYRFIFEEYY